MCVPTINLRIMHQLDFMRYLPVCHFLSNGHKLLWLSYSQYVFTYGVFWLRYKMRTCHLTHYSKSRKNPTIYNVFLLPWYLQVWLDTCITASSDHLPVRTALETGSRLWPWDQRLAVALSPVTAIYDRIDVLKSLWSFRSSAVEPRVFEFRSHDDDFFGGRGRVRIDEKAQGLFSHG